MTISDRYHPYVYTFQCYKFTNNVKSDRILKVKSELISFFLMSVETDKPVEYVMDGKLLTAAQYAAWLENLGDYTLGDKCSRK